MAATQKSAERIIRMGEDPRHVYMVGAPGLAAIIGKTYTPEEEKLQEEIYRIGPGEPFIICIQHPVSAEVEADGTDARDSRGDQGNWLRTIVVFPNADAGGQRMIFRHPGNMSRFPLFRHTGTFPTLIIWAS